MGNVSAPKVFILRLRSCKKEEPAEIRVLAADTLAYLIEVSTSAETD